MSQEEWFKLACFHKKSELGILSGYLEQDQVSHRLVEHEDCRVLMIKNVHESSLINFYTVLLMRNGLAAPCLCENLVTPSIRERVFSTFSAFPLTFVTLVLGLLGYFTVLGASRGLDSFLFIYKSSLFLSFGNILQGEIWRLISPAFLHFGIIHMLFNSLCIWEFGRRIERYAGLSHALGLFIVTAVGANVIQHLFGESVSFGGLSGVVYGYLGFLWSISALDRNLITYLPKAMFVFMFVWLIIGFFGVIDLFIDGKIANWAHLGGLIFGVIYGVAFGVMRSKVLVNK